MIQSMDCRFYGKEFGTDPFRNTPDRSIRKYTCSKDSEVKPKDKKESIGSSLKEKKRQGYLTTKWLKQNYCASPDACLPREIVYEQYIEFCRREKIPHACKATFGKLIRNTFPEVSSKRLGARGHSKYHYNGIRIKQSSEFRNASSSFGGVTRFSSASSNSEGLNAKKFSLSSKVGTLLPNFPDAEDLVIPASIDKAMIATFILMYKTHSQCILHMAISGNFEEIRIFLLHFWQGFPEHLISLTKLDIFVDLVTVCDSIFYRTLMDVFIPSLSFEMPEKLLRNIQNTGIHWNIWVECSLENMPQNLVEAKMALAKKFCRSLKRCAAFMHLMQVTRPILASDAPIFLYKEISEFLEDVPNYTCSPNPEYEGNQLMYDITTKQAKELQNVLKNCSTVGLLISTMDKMILGIQDWKKEDKAETRNFLFNWVYMLSRISYILTEKQSRYFITFHLLSSLIQEYLLLAIENRLDKEQEEFIHTRFKRHLKKSGRIAPDTAFRSPESCVLENYKIHPEYQHRAKERSTKIIENGNRERLKSQVPNLHNLQVPEAYPSSPYMYYSRSEILHHELPSCKYASVNACHHSTVYNCHFSPTMIGGHVEEYSFNGLSQELNNHLLLTHSAPVMCEKSFNSPVGLSLPHLESYQLERNCDVKANMTQEFLSLADVNNMV